MMVEPVDTTDLKFVAREGIRVRVPVIPYESACFYAGFCDIKAALDDLLMPCANSNSELLDVGADRTHAIQYVLEDKACASPVRAPPLDIFN